MTAVAPETLSRRSTLYRTLATEGARFEAVAGMACAIDFGDPQAEAEQAPALGLADLSALPRAGYKGRNAIAWLRENGVDVGGEDNRAYVQADRSLAARLAPTEVLLLAALDGQSPADALAVAWSLEGATGAYPVPRQGGTARVAVTGAHAAAMFAKLCGVDLRAAKFPNLTIAQTSVARLNVIVLRNDLGPTPAYDLVAESAAAPYLWACLVDAMAEFGGRPVGLGALRASIGA